MKQAPKKSPSSFTFHIVSDATGGLAGHTLARALTQFPGLAHKTVHHLFQDNPQKVEQTLLELKKRAHLVIFTMVEGPAKQRLRDYCSARKIPHFDVLGQVVDFITTQTGTAPANEIRRLHVQDQNYLKRLEAMEFTAQHDDSRRMETLHEAQIVIVGLSRVTKSPTSTFLGSHGFKVANVSIAEETGFPGQLKGLENKTIAFTMHPEKLHRIRKRRFEEFSKAMEDKGLLGLSYCDMQTIQREVLWAETEYRSRGYPILDITHSTVEEAAAHALKTLKLK